MDSAVALQQPPPVRVLHPGGAGRALAERTLDWGAAGRKFLAICEAQGASASRRLPPIAGRSPPHGTARCGRSTTGSWRGPPKLAGAPDAKAAGLELHVRIGEAVVTGEPLFTLDAETRGELAYAQAFVGGTVSIYGVATTAEHRTRERSTRQ